MPSTDALTIIPEPHRAAVARAIDTAFPNARLTDVGALAGGRSTALLYRVDVGGHPYVLRIITRVTPINDPARQFAALRVAAELGIAPAVHYTDPASGIAIMAFIDAQPYQAAFAADPGLVAEFGTLVRRLHDGPALAPFLDAFQCIEQGVLGLERAGVRLPPLLSRYLDEFAAVRAALSPHLVRGPSHNDLNPGNLLFDGRKFWLVDWESAWQNDPMFDLATMRHWFGFSAAQDAALLRGYFGDTPDALARAKLTAMSQVVSCYYAVVFLLITLQGGELPPSLDPDPETLPTFADAQARMRAGALPLASAEDRTRFALIMANDARRAARTPAFSGAIRLLRETAPA